MPVNFTKQNLTTAYCTPPVLQQQQQKGKRAFKCCIDGQNTTFSISKFGKSIVHITFPDTKTTADIVNS